MGTNGGGGEEREAAVELSSSCFYSLYGDVTVRVSEDLATAHKPYFRALYTYGIYVVGFYTR